MESQRHFPGLCKAIDRPEWIDDARYTTTAARAKNCRLLIQDINARLAELDLEPTLRSRFTKYDVWWQPVQTALEALSDEHCVAAGMFAALPPNVKDLEAGYVRRYCQISTHTDIGFAIADIHPFRPLHHQSTFHGRAPNPSGRHRPLESTLQTFFGVLVCQSCERRLRKPNVPDQGLQYRLCSLDTDSLLLQV